MMASNSASVFVKAGLLLSVVVGTAWAAKQTETRSLADLVVVGVSPGKVHLKTMAVPKEGPFTLLLRPVLSGWRERSVQLPGTMACPQPAVSLGRWGTKLLIRCPRGNPILLDLTQRLPKGLDGAHAHKDEGQFYFLPAPAGGIEVWEERAESETQQGLGLRCPIKDAQSAVQLDEGFAYLDAKGDLHRADGSCGDGGAIGTNSVKLESTARSGASTQNGATLGEGSLLFGTAPCATFVISDRGKRASKIDKCDFTTFPKLLKKYFPSFWGDVGKFETQDRTGRERPRYVTWVSVNYVHPHPELYAPILELASDEVLRPEKVGIWDELGHKKCPAGNGLSGKEEVEARFACYEAMERTQTERTGDVDAAVYRRILSFPGTWLYEYWIYYPFDRGGVAGHAHDPEHIFVEVDKLGGRPIAVLGAGHTAMTANNNYISTNGEASPISLPTYAIVERGKHATAPDVNGDGFFTAGVDANSTFERALVWGVRDAIGADDSHLSVYDSSMAAPRSKEKWLVPDNAGQFFPALQMRPSYKLLDPPVCDSKCKAASVKKDLNAFAALKSIADHADYKHPERIFKRTNLPAESIRVGYLSNGAHGMSLTYTQALTRIPKLQRIPLPGRIAVNGHWLKGAPDLLNCHPVVCSGEPLPTKTWGWGVAYEKHLTSLLGFYGGIERQYGGSWWRGGLQVEVPSSYGAWTIQVGPTTSSKLRPLAVWDIRVAFTPRWLAWKRKTGFGL